LDWVRPGILVHERCHSSTAGDDVFTTVSFGEHPRIPWVTEHALMSRSAVFATTQRHKGGSPSVAALMSACGVNGRPAALDCHPTHDTSRLRACVRWQKL
jgi:hypothetical protein